MNCTNAKAMMNRGLDNQLGSADRERLDDHLSRCPACSNAWNDYRTVAGATTSWAHRTVVESDPGDKFTSAVISRIVAENVADPRRCFPIRLLLAGLGSALLAAISYWVAPTFPIPLPVISAHPLLDLGEQWHAASAAIALPPWTWDALALLAAINVAFAWRARYPRPEAMVR